MSSENWMLSKNLCRCCHAQGDFKSLAEPCTVIGQELIYADLLKEYFDINLSPVPGVLCVLTYTICEACIGKLCDAVKFKKDVEACEKKFQELYNNNVITVESADIDISVKEELPDSCIEDDYSLPDETPDYEFDEEETKSEPDETVKKKTKKNVESKSRKKSQGSKKKAGRPKKLKEEPVPEEGEEEGDKKKNFAKETAPYYTFDRAEDGSHNYTCTACAKVYKKLSSVVQHYRHVHLRLRPKLRACFYCDVKVPAYMRAFHLEKEHGIPAPVCGACGKKFAYPFQVLRHQKHDHMGERKFPCNLCNMKFVSQGRLNKHLTKHSTVRLFKCEYCDKSFKWKKNLTTHIMMHLDIRPHVCSVCQEAFVQHSSLKYHITKRHPEMI